MATKFYLHDAASAVAGTLPATNAQVSADTPGTGTTIALANKTMNTTIGTLQKSIVKNTLANTNDQAVPIGRWLSDPIAAQTIASQTFTVHIGAAVSSTNSALTLTCNIELWRPGTGAVVSALYDVAHASGPFTPNPVVSLTEADETQSTSTTSQTSQDGDIIIIEIWRNHAVQSMATSYTNTLFYDGTTEASATTNAAYLNFANTVTMFTGGAAVDGYVHRRGPNYRR